MFRYYINVFVDRFMPLKFRRWWFTRNWELPPLSSKELKFLKSLTDEDWAMRFRCLTKEEFNEYKQKLINLKLINEDDTINL